MSILINMEMPNNCCECIHTAWNGRDDVCRFSGISALNIGRQVDCPLVEVPPHGRLIDADELMTKMIEYGWHHPDSTVHEFVEDELHTVIPADKDGET